MSVPNDLKRDGHELRPPTSLVDGRGPSILEVVLEVFFLLLNSSHWERAAGEANQVPEIGVLEHTVHLVSKNIFKGTVREHWRYESIQP